MRRVLATAVFAGIGLAMPILALGQTADTAGSPAPSTLRDDSTLAVPVWRGLDGTALTLDTAGTTTAGAAPGDGILPAFYARIHSTAAGLRFSTAPGVYARAGIGEVQWTPNALNCEGGAPEPPAGACLAAPPQSGVQHGEIGAGFTGNGIHLDVSVGQSQATPAAVRPLPTAAELPRVLPGASGADIAAPLWFDNSTATSINARGEVRVAPGTKLNLGASLGHVHFLPGSGLAADDDLDQTTLSLGIAHGPVSGSIVGHMLEPSLPGAPLYQGQQRWSGIDLGISVRLPWRGELNFGAQNVWTSGRSPLLIGPSDNAKDQGRVPYVQYHQDL
jgi:hypothetical protein